MENIALLSRYPQPSSHKKFENDYNIHKKRIEEIMARERIKHSLSNPYLEMIHKSKEANLRVETEFDSKRKENEVLFEKLETISRRKLKSEGNFMREYHNSMKDQSQKRRIEYQNRLLGRRLEEYRKSLQSKENIKKQIKREIKEYLQVRKKLRRIKDASKKPR